MDIETPAPTRTPRFVTPAFPPADAHAARAAVDALAHEVTRLEHTLGLAKRGQVPIDNYADWRNKALRALEHLRREQRAFKQWLRDQAAADRAARGQSVTAEAVLIRGLYALACEQVRELRRFGQEPEEAAQTRLDNARAYLERGD